MLNNPEIVPAILIHAPLVVLLVVAILDIRRISMDDIVK